MQSFIQQFFQHDSTPLVQFLKYVIGGGVATSVHVIVFHLVAWKLFPALEARDAVVRLLKLPIAAVDESRRATNSMLDNVVAFMFSNFVAYEINIHWVFKAGRFAWYIELALFYLVSGVSIAIGTGTMGWLIRRYRMQTTYAFLANLVTALLINFAMRKFVIFKG